MCDIVQPGTTGKFTTQPSNNITWDCNYSKQAIFKLELKPQVIQFHRIPYYPTGLSITMDNISPICNMRRCFHEIWLNTSSIYKYIYIYIWSLWMFGFIYYQQHIKNLGKKMVDVQRSHHMNIMATPKHDWRPSLNSIHPTMDHLNAIHHGNQSPWCQHG